MNDLIFNVQYAQRSEWVSIDARLAWHDPWTPLCLWKTSIFRGPHIPFAAVKGFQYTRHPFISSFYPNLSSSLSNLSNSLSSALSAMAELTDPFAPRVSLFDHFLS